MNQENHRYGLLARQQEKGEKNLELAGTESLLRMVEKLGLTESEQMTMLREKFAKAEIPDRELVADLSGQYFDLVQHQIDQQKVMDSTLFFLIYSIIFYVSRQTDDISDAYYDACDEAIYIATIQDHLDKEKLISLINRIY